MRFALNSILFLKINVLKLFLIIKCKLVKCDVHTNWEYGKHNRSYDLEEERPLNAIVSDVFKNIIQIQIVLFRRFDFCGNPTINPISFVYS